MAWNYVVTAHKSTAVSMGLTGYFTRSRHDSNSPLPDLVIVKGKSLGFYQLVSNGLKLYLDVPVFAKFTCLEVKLHYLFVIYVYVTVYSHTTCLKLVKTCSAS